MRAYCVWLSKPYPVSFRGCAHRRTGSSTGSTLKEASGGRRKVASNRDSVNTVCNVVLEFQFLLKTLELCLAKAIAKSLCNCAIRITVFLLEWLSLLCSCLPRHRGVLWVVTLVFRLYKLHIKSNGSYWAVVVAVCVYFLFFSLFPFFASGHFSSFSSLSTANTSPHWIWTSCSLVLNLRPKCFVSWRVDILDLYLYFQKWFAKLIACMNFAFGKPIVKYNGCAYLRVKGGGWTVSSS